MTLRHGNDVETRVRDLAARVARGLPLNAHPSSAKGARECRVHGAPAVSCATTTRKTHTSIQVHRNHPASPHAMALRIITCSPRPSRQVCNRRCRLGASGPHAFSVRVGCSTSKAPFASTAARPAFVTIAKRPFAWDGMGRI